MKALDSASLRPLELDKDVVFVSGFFAFLRDLREELLT